MALKSWIVSANHPKTDFPLENLPYGVFSHAHGVRIGVAIGDQVLDLRTCSSDALFAGLPSALVDACTASVLNPLMALGPVAWSQLRARLTQLLSSGQSSEDEQRRVTAALVPMKEANMLLPAQIGDYTDFYASIHHATRVGKLFRPDNPLLPNYKFVPIGYHGRASSIVVSGTEISRPSGQSRAQTATQPTFGPARSLDYELEVGAFIGSGNELGSPISIEEAEHHIFGLCLVNDWSARDLQAWEYQPLGPFLAKNFATTISPWIVPMEALAPFRVPMPARVGGDPQPLPYLGSTSSVQSAFDIQLEVLLQSRKMRERGMQPVQVSTANLRDLYWSLAQLVTHHASNGCNLRPGDLLATGTVSGPSEGSEGCLLEMKHRAEPLRLPTDEVREFLEDGDEVIFRAFGQRPETPRVGFGSCVGRIRSEAEEGTRSDS